MTGTLSCAVDVDLVHGYNSMMRQNRFTNQKTAPGMLELQKILNQEEFKVLHVHSHNLKIGITAH